jgi:LuxR family transcriptional regulator, maltose regulon positive regulatory protein
MSEQRPLHGSEQVQSGNDALPLIVTKIRIPRRREDLLPRRRLLDFIHAQLDRKLVLISAPAGYGKTSLLSDFASDTDLPVCWYTLDAFDRDLRVFLDHLIAAIAITFPGFGRRTAALLAAKTDLGRNLYPIVATLVQEIYDSIPEYFFLVLDDHHTVEDEELLNEFLDLFVTYVDENCHLIIASRTLPALPSLSLLVARRQAAGLSIDELRFTPREIQDLVMQNYQLEMSAEQASALAERTGGWITGLLLSSGQRWEQARHAAATRGTVNVNLYDYFTRQVLDRQPAELRDFLLVSSVLDEFSPELCSTVLGIERPLELLDQVRARSLFITEFEGSGGRLRYHDLFREFLQESLRKQGNDRFRELTMRAAEAYAQRGEWERAVSRYLTLGEHQSAAEIVGRTAANMFETGRWDTLASWIDALPEVERAANPQLLVDRAKIYTERAKYAQGLALYGQARVAFSAMGNGARAAYVQVLEGYSLGYQGHYAEAIALCQQVLPLVAGHTHEERVSTALAVRNVGLCQVKQGQMAEGRQSLEKALALYEALHSPFDVGMICHDLGWTAELQGDLDSAIEYYQAALDRWQQLGNPGPWANTLNGLGVIYHQQGKYDQAMEAMEGALEKCQAAGDLRVEAYVWASLGDLHRDLGAYQRARQAYEQALEVTRHCDIGFIVTYTLSALGNTARLQGDLVQCARQLQKAMELASQHGSDYEVGLCHISLGVLAGQMHDLAGGRHHLDQAIRLLQAGGFRRDLAVAYLHRAGVCFRAGDAQEALGDLERARSLAAELSFDQFLVVEGREHLDLIDFARQQAPKEAALADLWRRTTAHKARSAAQPEPVVRVEAVPALRMLALGSPQVELDGQPVQWTTIQSRDLLFFLLQQPRGLRKEEMGAVFWPDHPPRKLDGIFRSTVYRLRRSLFRESIVFEDGLYRFDWQSDYWFDVENFEDMLDRVSQKSVPEQIESLEEALCLYGGDYLEGVYADWCTLERERLRERCLRARESLAGLYVGTGDLHRAIEHYQQLVAQDPYRESAYRELMRWHFRLGDRVAAIRQYHLCSQILRDDLGLSPSPETDALYLKIIG